MLKKINQKGFTIIEVLIVLAIAGVIMLVVFLAVPALQRNSRNTQRANDASLVASAVNECISNKNGQINSCSGTSSAIVTNGAAGANAANLSTLDATKLRQFVTVTSVAPVANPATPAVNNSADSATIVWGAKCSTTGDSVIAASSRSFAVVFSIESTGSTATNRCIES